MQVFFMNLLKYNLSEKILSAKVVQCILIINLQQAQENDRRIQIAGK